MLAQIQDTLDQIDLKVSRDMRKYKLPKYDVVMVAASLAATGESRKPAAVAKGSFKVTTVLPNDRYEVQDLKKSPNRRTVVAVDAMKRWVTSDATR